MSFSAVIVDIAGSRVIKETSLWVGLICEEVSRQG